MTADYTRVPTLTLQPVSVWAWALSKTVTRSSLTSSLHTRQPAAETPARLSVQPKAGGIYWLPVAAKTACLDCVG